MKININNSSGFSILLAIGTIAILLILVTSLAMSYIRESKLSRFSYDEVIASTAAEGEFEYAMLKVRNHRDGFQDIVTPVEPDGKFLGLLTPRSKGLQTQYDIVASSTGKVFSLSGSEHLIIPLFTSNDGLIPGAIQSRNASYNIGASNVSELMVSNIGTMPWTIVAMSGSESIAITGTGNIYLTTSGNIRIKTSQCYSKFDGSLKSCSSMIEGDEELLYSYDQNKAISDFLLEKTEPYFILYNPGTVAVSVDMTSATPFTLPILTLTATASKADSSQVFRFTEDKGKYYDALKYGVFNTN